MALQHRVCLYPKQRFICESFLAESLQVAAAKVCLICEQYYQTFLWNLIPLNLNLNYIWIQIFEGRKKRRVSSHICTDKLFSGFSANDKVCSYPPYWAFALRAHLNSVWSQNQKTTEWFGLEGAFKDHLVQPYLCGRGFIPLDQVAQSLTQPRLCKTCSSAPSTTS